MNIIQTLNGDVTPNFLKRALNHCYAQLESVIEMESKTPKQFRRNAKQRFGYNSSRLHTKKLRLQREATYLEKRIGEQR